MEDGGLRTAGSERRMAVWRAFAKTHTGCPFLCEPRVTSKPALANAGEPQEQLPCCRNYVYAARVPEGMRTLWIRANTRNRRVNSGRTLFQGVNYQKHCNKYRAGIATDGKPMHIGHYDDPIEAALAGETQGPISPTTAKEFLTQQFDGPTGIGVFLDGQGEDRGFFHAGENPGYFARFGAGVSKGRAWIIMTNAQKDRFDPIIQAIVREFGWRPSHKQRGEK